MPTPTPLNLTVQRLARPTRLDRFLREHFPQWGRQAVQRLISARHVQVNGRTVWLASWEVQNGDRLAIAEAPVAKTPPPAHFDDTWIIAQTADLIAVNKPAGLLSEPTRWTQTDNLLDLAKVRFGEVVLFHRLDRDTSGVVLLTRPGPINKDLDRAFKTRTIAKEYLAVVATPNRLASSGVIDVRLGSDPQRRDRMVVVARGGQHALTRYAVEEERAGKQLVRLWPETGRTHQLRVHLAHLGAPILGDRLYGLPARADERLLLHAHRIDLPATAEFPARSFTAPLPEKFWPEQSPQVNR